MTVNPLMLVLAGLAIFIAALSLGAALVSKTAFSLLAFWGFPLGGVSPWLAVVFVTFVLGFLEKESARAQAATMLVLFPLFGAILFGVLFSFIGLFALQQAPFAGRFFWGAGLAALPAILCLGIVLLAHRG